ncbi:MULTISPECIES: hypothetical protein [Nitrosomonas]|uniref:Uncharacterized protein n=1 Tax=Nitrosomonas communis TaxID=44574 RepID=A0A0F7K9E3_9PROT|nr:MULTISPECIES: hypothetical protein [Nitrosomonas]AKH36850.1 hypothetical protein AAW31_01985 [Nitrosomonas communis]TYP82742.1 hypothetical protein BCL69_104511 [Nitrosomonas communis]UVS61948.1 hypothetical protein NX761_02095 [Nitrosomonas sp. PLL12]
MNISQIRFLITILSVVFALSAQATTLKNLKSFDSTNTVQYLQNDWNPADGDTHWGDIKTDNMSTSTDPYLLDFFGAYVVGDFFVGNDLWETVSIKSLAGEVDLDGTQEIQLLVRPRYTTSKPYVSILLRLIMEDGSMWDQIKVLANNIWQRGVFPVNEDAFARVEWSPQGVFNLGKVASWEVILVDLPPNNHHSIDLRAMYMKGNYDTSVNKNVAEPFGVEFYNGDGSMLFRHADWNPADGDTDWLYHVWKQPTYYDPSGFMKAVYRSESDPWETVSLRKEAQSFFDLTTTHHSQIVALVRADLNLDPNALIMSLTMEDGSVWQQGRPLDIVRSTSLYHYRHDGNNMFPYRFSLDPNGKGWTMAAWGPAGTFDLTRVKAWELFFNNLGQGEHTVLLGSIDTMDTMLGSLIQAGSTFGATGQAQWLDHSFSSVGVVADISSGGNVGDSFFITSESIGALGLGFNLEVATSYVNTASDAVVFRLTTADGKIWQQSYHLPQIGRSIFRVYTSCPSTYPYMARPDPDDMRCKNILAGFYGINPADIIKWEITLNSPPAGEHKIGINLITTIQ